jgi:hypothetical protein
MTLLQRTTMTEFMSELRNAIAKSATHLCLRFSLQPHTFLAHDGAGAQSPCDASSWLMMERVRNLLAMLADI